MEGGCYSHALHKPVDKYLALPILLMLHSLRNYKNKNNLRRTEMIQIKNVLYRVNPLVAAATLILAALVPVLAAQQTSALGLINRSLMLSSTALGDDNEAPDGSTYTFGNGVGEVPAGDPRNGLKVDHTYTFNVESADDLEGFTIEYCTSAFAYLSGADSANACTGPTGFDASNWDGGTVTVTNVTNGNDTETFDVAVPNDSPSNNYVELTTAGSALPVDANDQLVIAFPATETEYFTNPTVIGTFFATIMTYDDDAEAEAGTPAIDTGTTTSSTTESISIYTRVQETLNFSVEGEDGSVAGPTDEDPGSTGACEPLTEDGLIYMGDTNNALRTDQAYTANSYFRLATNAANGTKVYYSGDTLRSGSNDINALTDAASVASAPGSEQFGLAIDTTASTLTQLTTIPDAYDEGDADEYAFNTNSVTNPVEIASASSIVDCDTGHVEYVANIATNTPAGIYTTKINYIAAPSY